MLKEKHLVKFRKTQIDLETEIIPIGYDLIFKKIFGEKDNNIFIKYLLKVILDIEPKYIKILNNERLGEHYVDKKTAVDLIVELDDGKRIVIEINKTVNEYVKERNFFYMSRIISSSLNNEDDYLELNEFIQINFDFAEKHKRPIEVYKVIEEETGEILTNKLLIYRIDIQHFIDLWYNEKGKGLDEKSKYIASLGMNKKKELVEIVKDDEVMGMMYDIAKELSTDERIIGAYNLEVHRNNILKAERKEGLTQGLERGLKQGLEQGLAHGLEQGRLEGMVQGLEQGKLEEKTSIAKNMLKKNIDINAISEITGLSIKEINKLK